MGSDAKAQAEAVGDFEDFPMYSGEVLRHQKLSGVFVGLFLFAVCAIILILLRSASPGKWMLAVCFVLAPVCLSLFLARNPVLRFSAEGIARVGSRVIPWSRVSSLRRTTFPVLVLSSQETLSIKIASEGLPATGIRSLLSNLKCWVVSSGRNRILRFTNYQDVIDSIIAAMEKYSDRDIRALVR